MPARTDPTAPRSGFDPATFPQRQMYNLINSIVAPRPIAWVSTRSAAGVANVAPHSYCMIVCPDPPIIAFSSTGAKDTLRNVRATREFVFNQVPEWLAEAMNLTSGDFPANVSEFDWAGLTPVPSEVVGAPRVGEAPAAMECRLLDIQEFGRGPSHLIIGEVVHIAIDPAFIADGILDVTRTRPVGRLARIAYSHTREFYAMPRPTYQGLLDAGAQPKKR
jgi:flavin reductase (DIM6/NTAB) family NADH-FMN oxidoreductase RutF